MDETNRTENIPGVLLAGGSARRMGGCDKSLLPLDHKPILDHVIARAQPQIGQLLINTNSDSALFSRYGLPIIHDTTPGFAGPLAGIAAAMEWLRAQPTEPAEPAQLWLASFPADSPFFPEDLVQRLLQTALESKVEIACAASHNRLSPLFALWSTDLLDDLNAQLSKKERKVGAFLERHRYSVVHFDCESLDPFFNINTVEDLKAARHLIEGS